MFSSRQQMPNFMFVFGMKSSGVSIERPLSLFESGVRRAIQHAHSHADSWLNGINVYVTTPNCEALISSFLLILDWCFYSSLINKWQKNKLGSHWPAEDCFEKQLEQYTRLFRSLFLWGAEWGAEQPLFRLIPWVVFFIIFFFFQSRLFLPGWE